jgi:predicted RNase H-like HicB family nuclease
MAANVDYMVVIEQDEEGWFVATVPSLPGCHTQGGSIDEVRGRIREAIEAYLGDEEAPASKFVALERIAV